MVLISSNSNGPHLSNSNGSHSTSNAEKGPTITQRMGPPSHRTRMGPPSHTSHNVPNIKKQRWAPFTKQKWAEYGYYTVGVFRSHYLRGCGSSNIKKKIEGLGSWFLGKKKNERRMKEEWIWRRICGLIRICAYVRIQHAGVGPSMFIWNFVVSF